MIPKLFKVLAWFHYSRNYIVLTRHRSLFSFSVRASARDHHRPRARQGTDQAPHPHARQPHRGLHLHLRLREEGVQEVDGRSGPSPPATPSSIWPMKMRPEFGIRLSGLEHCVKDVLLVNINIRLWFTRTSALIRLLFKLTPQSYVTTAREQKDGIIHVKGYVKLFSLRGQCHLVTLRFRCQNTISNVRCSVHYAGCWWWCSDNYFWWV